MKNKKIFIILFFAVLVILVGLGVWIGFEIAGNHASADAAAPSGYTAVYMTSGDIYFGKVHWFPRPYLTDALYITRNTGQNGQTQVGLASFKSVVWGPVGDIYFNPQQVLFTASLRNDSQIVQVIQNPTLLNAAAAANNTPQPQAVPPDMTGATSAATSTATSSKKSSK